MGSLFSKVGTKKVRSPVASNPGALNVVEKIHLGEETTGDMKDSKRTRKEPTSATGENRKDVAGQYNNQDKDNVR